MYVQSAYTVYQHVKNIFKEQALKRLLLYVTLIGALISNMQTLQLSGYNVPELFLNNVVPEWTGTLSPTLFLKQYIYKLSHVILGEPVTLITGAMPYLENYEQFMPLSGESLGYFERDKVGGESEQRADYTPQLPTPLKTEINPESYKDYYYILKNFLSGDGSLGLDIDMIKQWDFYSLMNKSLHMEEVEEGPQILIFHTHAREAYADGTTVVDVGAALKESLETTYGIKVLHVIDEFYAPTNSTEHVEGTEYEIMEPTITQVLKDNPSISVCIDIHRDGVNSDVRLVTDIDGKQTAKIMFVNGLCMHRNLAGEIVKKTELPNPYLEDNLAFSMQALETAYKYYPGFARKIFCKEWRYSLHMKPLSLLLEVGAQTNSGEEALNAAEPLANIIAKVLQKD